MSEDSNTVEDSFRDDKGRFLTGNNGGGRQKGSRNRLGTAFVDALQADFEEHGTNAIKMARMQNPLGYCKMVSDILPKEILALAFNINIDKDKGDFPDNVTIEGILQSVANEAGVEGAKLLGKMFGIEYSPVIEAEPEPVEAKVDYDTAMSYATRKR